MTTSKTNKRLAALASLIFTVGTLLLCLVAWWTPLNLGFATIPHFNIDLRLFLWSAVLVNLLILIAPKIKQVYYYLFFSLGLLALFTINSYIYPTSQNIFKNTDYHAFELLGIEFEDSLHLANENFPQIALWDDARGMAKVKRKQNAFDIQLNNFEVPFFIETEKKDHFDLANNYVPLDIEQGFEIFVNTPQKQAEQWLKMEVEPIEDEEFLYIFTHKDTIRDTSAFQGYLSVGIHIKDILPQKIQDLTFDSLDLLANTYLLREKFIDDKTYKNDHTLCFFPGPNMRSYPHGITIKANNQTQILTTTTVFQHQDVIQNNKRFFTRLGGTNQTSYWKAQVTKDKGRVLYHVPVRHPLKKDKDTVDLFISSSAIDILQDQGNTAGYHFPIFNYTDHYFHFNGNIHYEVGDSRDMMLFSVIDQLTPLVREGRVEGQKEAFANDTFRLYTAVYKEMNIKLKNGESIDGVYQKEHRKNLTIQTTNGIQTIDKNQIQYEETLENGKIQKVIPHTDKYFTWLFKVHDFRASNTLQSTHLTYFILFFFAFVLLSFYFNPITNVLKTEAVLYAFLIGFLMVKLLLLWRVSTFIPLEGVTGKVLDKLRSPSYFYWTIQYTFLFFGIRLLAILLSNRALYVHNLHLKQTLFSKTAAITGSLLLAYGVYHFLLGYPLSWVAIVGLLVLGGLVLLLDIRAYNIYKNNHGKANQLSQKAGWAYVWTLFPLVVGVGFLIMGANILVASLLLTCLLFFTHLLRFEKFYPPSIHFKKQPRTIPMLSTDKWNEWLELGRRNQFVFYKMLASIMVGTYLLLFAGTVAPTLERFFNIALPVLIFFAFSSILLYIQNTRDKGLDLHNDHLKPTSWDRANILLLLNWVICQGMLLITDSGFGVIFMLFTPLLLAYRATIGILKNRQNVIWAIVFVLAAIAMLGFESHIFKGLFNLIERHVWLVAMIFGGMAVASLVVFQRPVWNQGLPFRFNLIIAIGIAAVVALALVDIDFVQLAIAVVVMGLIIWLYFHPKQPQKALVNRELLSYKTTVFKTLTIIALLILGFNNTISQVAKDRQYVKYRALVHTEDSLEVVTQKIGFGSTGIYKLLQASQNHWFIEQFMDNKNTSIVAPFSQKYFQLKPHFQKGVTYTTQTTDLVTLRYMLAEHSQWLIGLLVLLAFMLFLTAILNASIWEQFNQALIGMVLLIPAIAFFVWITATNRFIFFGQDFPIISLQSHMTLFFSFTMLLAVILFLKEGKAEAKPLAKLVIPTLIVLMAIGVIGFKGKSSKQSNFTLGGTIERAKSDFNELNKDFKTFQKQLGVAKLSQYRGNVSQLIDDFEDWAKSEGSVTYNNLMVSPNQLFSKSIFNHFDSIPSERKINPEEVLHLRRPESRFYEFATNNYYYLLRSPQVEQQEWRGSLYAADAGRNYQIISRSRKGLPIVYLEKDKTYQNIFAHRGEKADEKIENPLKTKFQNIDLISLSGKWNPTGEPIVLLSRRAGSYKFNKANYSISNAKDYVNSTKIENFFAFRLMPNDYINLSNGENLEQYKLVTNYNQYLAKNLWLNGNQRLLYPLGQKFNWAYNYANLLKNKIKDDENVKVSIDYELTDQAYDILAKNQRGKSDASVVVMDGNGQIRLMVDYKKATANRFDPNNIKENTALFKRFYLESNRSSERSIFGTKALQRLDNGPGSSIKPIMYSAVTSGYNMNWGSLKSHVPTAEDNEKGGLHEGKQVSKYGGQYMPKWKIGPIEEVDNKFYMIRSRNYYHSLVLFLGSYSKAQLQTLGQQESVVSMNYPYIKETVVQHHTHFPIFSFGGRKMIFNPDSWPQFTNIKSILATQLAENYDVVVDPKANSGTFEQYFSPLSKEKYDLVSTSKSQYKIWSTPEPAHFYQIDRGGDLYKANGVRQSTVGGYPVDMTPIKMAEMGGRMVSLNKNLHATLKTDTILIDSMNRYQSFTYDDTWSQGSLLNFYHNNLFSSLQQVTTIGTAGFLGGLAKELNEDGYHIYAKTGTIAGEGYRKADDKHLLIIVSANDLTKSSLSTLKTNKFYVVYISMFNNGDYTWRQKQEIIALIRAAHEAQTVQRYFGGS